MSLFCDADADLNFAQTEWGDSGVYVCSVISSQDLSGNSEDYTELIVLGKLGANNSCGTRTRGHTHVLHISSSSSFGRLALTKNKKCQTTQTSEKG